MIRSLQIKNYIIVNEININFSEGLQVLTGETGAGKSILIGALNIILGSSLKSGILLDSSKPAYMEASFDVRNNKTLLQLLEDLDIEPEDGEIFISKEVSKQLKGKSFINGRRVTNQIVRQFREILFDFHSQRDQTQLFNTKYQLSLLDQFGKLEKDSQSFLKSYREVQALERDLKARIATENEINEKIQLYTFQNDELIEAELKFGEIDEINNELNLLNNSHEIIELATDFEQNIYEKEGSVFEVLRMFASRLENYSKDHEIIVNALQMIDESTSSLESAVQELQTIQEVVNLDPERKTLLEERLNFLNQLISKYKKDVPELIAYQKEISKEIANQKSSKKEIKALELKLTKIKAQTFDLALKLSKKRRAAAQKMEKEVIKNIRLLAVPDGRFEIEFDSEIQEIINNPNFENITSLGLDSIQFCFAANKGKNLQIIKDAASGGELSRLLLTMKKILSSREEQKTIVFDEIDSGVGGKTADYLGEFIAEISKSHQVLCITHLPQVAAFGKNQFAIFKENTRDNTFMKISLLSQKERVLEIARMLSGSDSEVAMKHASELLKK